MQQQQGLWLPNHPFVQAVCEGSATREELRRWVRQVHCITKTYGEVLLSLNPPPSVGVWLDPWRDLDLLVQLGRALGLSKREMKTSQPNLAARAIQIWLRHHLTDRSRHMAAQACWALVEAMAPEAGAKLADGAGRNFGLEARHRGYFRVGMKSRKAGYRYAEALLNQIPRDGWPWVEAQTLLVSRLAAQLYASTGEFAPSARREHLVVGRQVPHRREWRGRIAKVF
jgi:pyrroloquinoline quinone (PQQ) biosynthesis protein C